MRTSAHRRRRRCRGITTIPSPTKCDNNNATYKYRIPGPKHTSWRQKPPRPPRPRLKIRKNTPRTRPLIAGACCRSQPCTSPRINTDHNIKVTAASGSPRLACLLLYSPPPSLTPSPSLTYSRQGVAKPAFFCAASARSHALACVKPTKSSARV